MGVTYVSSFFHRFRNISTSIDRFTNERIFEFGNGKNSGKNTSPMGDGGGRLAGLVGALMEGRIRIGSPPRVRGRWRQIRDTTVRRGVVPLLHGPRPHRPHPHAPSPLVVAVRRILENRQAKRHNSQIVDKKFHSTRFTSFSTREKEQVPEEDTLDSYRIERFDFQRRRLLAFFLQIPAITIPTSS